MRDKAAYFNEVDRDKAAWIRELQKAGVVADGEVDERPIEQVEPADLRGFTQCHFFAGIAVWSYALRLAGWPDSRECWTGSCPCPSFSSAGKGQGFDDARHLWPQWHRLIRQCRPGTILGEQVASAIQHGWLDLVSTDLEAEGYAVAPAVLGAHSAGAPHIRQRLYFLAHAESTREQRLSAERQIPILDGNGRGEVGLMAYTEHDGLTSPDGLREAIEPSRATGQDGEPELAGSGDTGELANAGRTRCEGNGPEQVFSGRAGIGENERIARPGTVSELGEPLSAGLEGFDGHGDNGNKSGRLRENAPGPATTPSSLSNFWSDAEWLPCRDGKLRPVRPGTFPLASGTPARVLRLRGYGDAINAETAKAFIEVASQVLGS